MRMWNLLSVHNGDHLNNRTPACIEGLEDRRLLSVVPALAVVSSSSPAYSSSAASTLAAKGHIVDAIASQPFRAVIGTIAGLTPVPNGYSFRGTIDWGDKSPDSPASFVRQPNGAIAVLGSHTYSAVGSDDITVTLVESPPPFSAAPIILVSQFHSSAKVIAPDGGTTLNEPAGVLFSAGLGAFWSRFSVSSMKVQIDWGDGTTSAGSLLALPTAGPMFGGVFEVIGTHRYAGTGSYLVHATVTSRQPPPPTAGGPLPDVTFLVAQLDSVIDVLPISPTAVAALI